MLTAVNIDRDFTQLLLTLILTDLIEIAKTSILNIFT